ncbi:MAG: HIT family protein [Parcubacteria group bacterium]|nr:HIT family protein [Parcubacteria group bacterium]
MSDCIFCKIVKGEIPAAKVYEDDELIAFLDINPINPGHTLIIPKEHYATLLETPELLVSRLFTIVPNLAKAVLQATDTAAFNLGVNTGAVSGQVVEHVHLHIMPRREGDGYEMWHGKPYASQDEMNQLANAIRAFVE